MQGGGGGGGGTDLPQEPGKTTGRSHNHDTGISELRAVVLNLPNAASSS